MKNRHFFCGCIQTSRPIHSGYQIKGSQVIVSFEKESLFGGLMVGDKGMAKDYREADKYVEHVPGRGQSSVQRFYRTRKFIA
jgi:hypothetical protein